MYLAELRLPSRSAAEDALEAAINKRSCYNNVYPFGVFDHWEALSIPLYPLTIFYGGNGSGKTTLLNLLGEKLELERRSVYNRTPFFQPFVELCHCTTTGKRWHEGKVLTSDDVFDDLLDQRSLNQGIDLARTEVLQEYRSLREEHFQMQSLEDFDHLKKVVLAQRKKSSGSDFVRRTLGGNLRGRSNGETALHYFTHQIQEDGLYLLDEPENSLSPAFQQELAGFLADSVRFFRCQLILSTHSPFLLAMPGAVVYDLDGWRDTDQEEIQPSPWVQLPAVQAYHAFFQAHAQELEDASSSPQEREREEKGARGCQREKN